MHDVIRHDLEKIKIRFLPDRDGLVQFVPKREPNCSFNGHDAPGQYAKRARQKQMESRPAHDEFDIPVSRRLLVWLQAYVQSAEGFELTVLVERPNVSGQRPYLLIHFEALEARSTSR